MRPFERISEELRKEWRLQLRKGCANFGYGYSTGYIIFGAGDQRRFNTLKEIDNALQKEKANQPIK